MTNDDLERIFKQFDIETLNILEDAMEMSVKSYSGLHNNHPTPSKYKQIWHAIYFVCEEIEEEFKKGQEELGEVSNKATE